VAHVTWGGNGTKKVKGLLGEHEKRLLETHTSDAFFGSFKVTRGTIPENPKVSQWLREGKRG